MTFTATVSGNSSTTPTGSVSFYDGSTLLGTAALSSMMGAARATFNTSALSVGAHTIKAVYSGDSTYPTNSTTLTQTVTQATATVNLSSSSNPSQAGQSVTFTATVSGNSSTPTGSVSFYDGSTLLGTVALSSMMGAARATFNTSALSVGTHTIQAVYSGDSTYPTSSATLTQTVTPDTVNVGLTSSNNPSLVGQSVTFTAAVTPTVSGSPTPSGTVTFKDGSTVLATVAVTNVQGQYLATFTTSALTAGAHTITASYSDPNYAHAAGQQQHDRHCGVAGKLGVIRHVRNLHRDRDACIGQRCANRHDHLQGGRDNRNNRDACV